MHRAEDMGPLAEGWVGLNMELKLRKTHLSTQAWSALSTFGSRTDQYPHYWENKDRYTPIHMKYHGASLQHQYHKLSRC